MNMKNRKTESTPQEEFIKNYKCHHRIILMARLALLLTFLFLWQYFTDIGIIDAFIFSSPKRIILCLADMINKNLLFNHLAITLYETLLSFGLVIMFGMLFAIIMWLCKPFTEIIEPYIVALNSLPKSALAPILIVWLGNNMKTIIVCAISVAIFGTIMTLYTGFTNTDPNQIKLIKTLGGNKWHILTRVLLPSNFPLILATMKVNLGLSLVGVIIGEFLAAKRGLGYLIIYGSQVFKMDWVLLSIVLLCLLSVILYGLINLISRIYERK